MDTKLGPNFFWTACAQLSPPRSIALSALASLLMTTAGCPATPGTDAGGADGSVPPVDAPRADAPTDAGPTGCTVDADCDDGVDCTADTCTVATGVCRNNVTPALCPAGSSCHPTRGCEMGRPCATDADCDDDDACTVNERCDPAARTCVVDPLDGDGDGDAPRVCGGSDCDDANSAVRSGADERCNSRDDDCDGTVDEGFDLRTDPEHCGACNAACIGGVCSGGTCGCSAGDTLCMTRPGPGTREPLCVDTATDPWNSRPSDDELIDGAQQCLKAHFDAIGRRDRAACRETMALVGPRAAS